MTSVDPALGAFIVAERQWRDDGDMDAAVTYLRWAGATDDQIARWQRRLEVLAAVLPEGDEF